MSDMIQRQLDLVINLLETLPKRFCDEMEKRESIQKEKKCKKIQADLDFYAQNVNELNKFMSGLVLIQEKETTVQGV